MSTYYYMACECHKAKTDKIIAVQRLAGQHIDNPEHLLLFLMKHRDCPLRFFSEYDDERYEYKADGGEK